MRKQYLLLGAASMLMLAACSEDIKGPETNGSTSENVLNLKSLSPASQAGRVSLPGETRGPKADRLQLVAKIAPIAESQAAKHNWSATGISIANGNAYVSWHSNHQAQAADAVPADAWGGALDVIDINALIEKRDGIITNTLTSSRVKFNNVVAAGTNLYFPLTCYNNGAVIGRLAAGTTEMDTISIPGSSANAIAVDGTTLYAVTGYAGGAYSMPVSFNKKTEIVEIAPMAADFGGKYIANGTVLRTDKEKAYLLSLNGGTERALDVPLVSEEKYAEAYDPAKGEWYPLEGEKATYYGKHTMAMDGNYTYVGAGKNGLRVYAASGLVWSNNTNTTAVTVAEVGGKKYVFAATGAGLRVYEPYDNGKVSLPLYAMEVLDYDANGNAADHEGMNQPQAGTTAHSSNFVAVDSVSGLIFVACGQSGVYVFKLNDVVAKEWATGFQWPTGSNVENITEETGKFTVPAAPAAEEGKEFVGWKGDDEKDYTAGEEVELPAGTIIKLEPQFKDKEYAYVLHFDGNKGEGIVVSNLPGDVKSDEAKVTIPNVKPTVPAGTLNPEFIGWATDPEMSVAHKDAGLWTPIMPGDEYTCTDAKTTLYAIWATNITAGGNQGGVAEEDPKEDDNSGAGGGAGDIGGEYVE